MFLCADGPYHPQLYSAEENITDDSLDLIHLFVI